MQIALKLDLKVGYSCNNNCVHCVISDNKKALLDAGKRPDLTTDECLRQIYSARSRGITWITFTGGEPSIRSDFISLLKASHEQGLNITIQTNGRGFHDPGLCKQLEGLNIKIFLIALHGPNADIHDRITQKKNSFNQTVQAIRNLLSMGFDMHGKVVISRINATYLVETLDFFNCLGVKNACFAFPHALGNARINFAEVVPRYNEIRPEIDRLIIRSKELNFNLELEAFTFCTLSDPIYADEMIQLRPMRCKTVPVGEEEYDWEKVRKLIKAKFPQCKKCAFNEICEGPWKEYPEAYGSDEFKPLPMEAYLDFLARGMDKT